MLRIDCYGTVLQLELWELNGCSVCVYLSEVKLQELPMIFTVRNAGTALAKILLW